MAYGERARRPRGAPARWSWACRCGSRRRCSSRPARRPWLTWSRRPPRPSRCKNSSPAGWSSAWVPSRACSPGTHGARRGGHAIGGAALDTARGPGRAPPAEAGRGRGRAAYQPPGTLRGGDRPRPTSGDPPQPGHPTEAKGGLPLGRGVIRRSCARRSNRWGIRGRDAGDDHDQASWFQTARAGPDGQDR